jgi:purine-binding chemotaxis protein CheW
MTEDSTDIPIQSGTAAGASGAAASAPDPHPPAQQAIPQFEGLLRRLMQAGVAPSPAPSTQASISSPETDDDLGALLDTLADSPVAAVPMPAIEAAITAGPLELAVESVEVIPLEVAGEEFERIDSTPQPEVLAVDEVSTSDADAAELLEMLSADEELPTAAIAEQQEPTQSIEAVLATIDSELADLEVPAPPVAPLAGAVAQQVVFRLGGTNYAVPIAEVLEMSTVPRTTLLPNVPDFVRGLTNLRGEVLAVIDLRMFLGLAISGDPTRERMLVVRPRGTDTAAGLIVESVRGLARVATQQLRQPAGPLEDPVMAYLTGVTEHEDQVLHALDLQKLFRAPDIIALSAQ